MNRLIHDLGQLLSAPESETARIQRVADRVGAFVQEPPSLNPRFTRPGHDTYARYLVHRDSQHRFVVVAMVWGPGQRTPVHDHGTWGIIGMLQGHIAAWTYQRQDDGSQEGYAELEESGYLEAGPGTVLPVVFPPDDEIHRLQNPGDQVAIGLHVYGKAIERCRSFDLNTNQWTWRELHYTDA